MPIAPRAERRHRAIVHHGDELVDDYWWLRDRDDPAVKAYLEAENQFGETLLAPLAPLRETLYQEMLSRIKQTDVSVPYRDGAFWYYQRTEEGKQYPIYCRKAGSVEGAEEVLLDLNVLGEGHSYVGLGVYAVSPNGRYLAYSIDFTGYREYTLRVLDLATRAEGLTPIERTGSAAWAADNQTLFFTTENESKRDNRLFRVTLGGSPSLVLEEPDERFRVLVTLTRSRRYLAVHSASHLTSDVRILRADRPLDPWVLVAPRIHDREYDLDHLGDRFLIRVNDAGRNFRVVSAPESDPGPANWTEVVAHRTDVIVEGIECFSGHWIAWERSGGLPRIRVTDVATARVRYVGFPEEVYDARPAPNAEWETARFRYAYESFVTPTSVYDYEVETGESILLKRREVLGGYDPTRYHSERLAVTGHDGTTIPVSFVSRRDIEPTGRVHLTGYGAYGISYPVSFNSNRLSLLDRGVSFAVAHVRGGGELGRPWHDAGRMAAKQTTFNDFIACADHLVNTGRATRDGLVIEGGSAGGLLIGAVVNQRPDLAATAILQVPFVDVINTMSDPTLPLTVGEFEEWANPAIEEQYRWIRAYCPYSNLAERAYPAMLVRASLNDSQVMYWEPAKFVAKLRTLKLDGQPLILLTNLGAGHFGASGRYDRLREIAADYAFILWRIGAAPASGYILRRGVQPIVEGDPIAGLGTSSA